MLVRIRCMRCRVRWLWTDDPTGFIESICLRRSRCEAVAVAEEFGAERVPEAEREIPASSATEAALAGLNSQSRCR